MVVMPRLKSLKKQSPAVISSHHFLLQTQRLPLFFGTLSQTVVKRNHEVAWLVRKFTTPRLDLVRLNSVESSRDNTT